MLNYAIVVRNRETGLYDILVEGKAKSRRKFLKENADNVRGLRNGHKQWKCGTVG